MNAFFLLMYKNIRNVSLCVWNKMADIKEEKTRFDIYFFPLEFSFIACDCWIRNVFHLLAFFCDAFGWNVDF